MDSFDSALNGTYNGIGFMVTSDEFVTEDEDFTLLRRRSDVSCDCSCKPHRTGNCQTSEYHFDRFVALITHLEAQPVTFLLLVLFDHYSESLLPFTCAADSEYIMLARNNRALIVRYYQQIGCDI